MIRVYVDWDNDGIFTSPYDDITNDVANGSILIGIDDPLQRVANVGTLVLMVDNAERKYTPKNTSGVLYGKLLPGRPVIVQIVYDDGETVQTCNLFTGKIATIEPGSQRFGDRYATIECRDRVADYRDYNQLSVPLQFGKTADHLVRIISSDVYHTDRASVTIVFNFMPVNNETFRIGDTTYRWRSSLEKAYDVLIAATSADCIRNLKKAIHAGSGAGTAYHASTERHRDVTASIDGSSLLTIKANARGTWANGIVVHYDMLGGWQEVTLDGGVDGPAEVDYDPGLVTFDYAGDTWKRGDTNALSAIEDVVKSAYGYWWVSRDGVPVFRNKDWWFRQASADAEIHLNEQQSQLEGRLSIDDVYNVVAVTYTPRRTLATRVIARAGNVIEVLGGGSEAIADRWNAADEIPNDEGLIFLKLKISDEDTGDLGGVLNVVQPVPGTDYTVVDDVGFDYTTSGNISFSIAVVGPTLEITIGNTAAGTLWVHDLQVRGTMLKKSDEQQAIKQNVASIAAYGKRTPLTYVMPLPMSPVVLVDSIAYYLLDRHSVPEYQIEAVKFDDPLADPAAFFELFAHDLGAVVTISEYQSCTTRQMCAIRSIACDFEAGEISQMAWGLWNLGDHVYWLLGVAQCTILGTYTYLGI